MPNLLRRLLLPLALLEVCWLALWLRLDLFVDFWAYQGLFALAFAAYVWALSQALDEQTGSVKRQAMLVLLPAICFRLTLLPAPLAFSDDIFRYVWDGRVSAASIDPYRYAPGDQALAPLRDAFIWPNVNAKDQPSPYPPLLEAWFSLVYWIWPESLTAFKLAMSLLDLGVIGLLLVLLYQRGQPLSRAAIYAWSPQTVFQVAFSGHNEPLLLSCILSALVFGQMAGGRQGLGRMLGGFALGLAVLAKLVPVLVLPVLARCWGWRAAATLIVTVGAVYGALLLRGQHLFGGLAIETSVSQFNDGIYYLVARGAALVVPENPHSLAQPIVRAVLLALIVWLTLRPRNDLSGPLGTILAGYVLLAASVAPWYALWVLPFVCLDALPSPFATRPFRERLFGGYWLAFSWTAAFSELYYLGSSSVWVVAHILVYALPCANLGLSLFRVYVAPRLVSVGDTSVNQ